MRAWAVVENKAPLQCIEIADPTVEGTQVLLSVTHCGVCHSDLHFWKGSYNMGGGRVMKLAERGVSLPRAIGHEIVARVVALGPDAEGPAVGSLQIVYPWIGCGACERCASGQDNLCDRPNAIGVMQDGGFGEKVVVPHPRYLVDPGTVDPALAATFACSGITVYSAIGKIRPLDPDEPVLLIGAGGLGLSAISMLRALGHRSIVSADIDPEKRAAALEAGASAVFDSRAPDAEALAREAGGGWISAAIDFVNTDETAALGLAVLKKGGRLVLVGVAGGELVVSLASMIFRPRAIEGSATGTLQDLRDVVALAEAGALQPIPLTRLRPDEANRALEMLREGQVRGRIVLSA